METNSERNRSESPLRPLRLGEFEVYPDRFLVCGGGGQTAIRQQTLKVLLYLIERRDRVVPRDELHQAIWGDVAVTPDALVQCIVEIRKVFGDSAREPRLVRTVPKIGYAYVGPSPAPSSTAAAVPAKGAARTAIAPAPSVLKRYLPFAAAGIVLVGV